ncbi:Chromosome partition protein Smc [Candidatus Venteria ishoeyi]|uniref:Chromosome partition protein Smc n=2 Tax=Candidatus Venteria ishoeyi TaxID=1899563 RepID=A0A1H6F6A5_9GAMM|nr:Chromosome partition protein Smc [Candidatus Venteria ishoeyi]
MNTHYLKPALLAVLLSTSLTGCSGMGGAKGDDATQTKTEGAIGGALLGALAGGLLGGDAKSAAIGAAIGGGVGYLVGNEVAERKKQYANKEALIAGETRYTTKMLQETQSLNTQLSGDIRKYKKSISRLNKQIAKDSSKRATLKKQQAAVQKSHKNAKKALDAINQELKVSQTLYDETKKDSGKKNAANLKQWQKKISALKTQKVKLETNTNQLQAVSKTIAL